MNNQLSQNASKGFTLIEVMVALSLLALGAAGFAQLYYAAYRHIALAQEVQSASYFADTHFNTLSTQGSAVVSVQNGDYSRGIDVPAFPWELYIEPLSDDVLLPASSSLSDKVQPLTANLTVWVDDGNRELRFHSLLLLRPQERKVFPRPNFKLNDGK